MEFVLRQIHKAGSFGWLYLANLFLGFHIFTIHFIDSSFFATFLGKEQVGLLFTVSFLLSLVVLASSTQFLRRFGAYQTILVAAALDYGAVLGLVQGTRPGLLMACFALHTLLVPVMLFGLDIFFENKNGDKDNTGNARGIYLTIATGASLFSPIIAGFLVGETGRYGSVYLVSALFLLPFIGILTYRFRSFTDPHYRLFRLARIFPTLRAQPDIFRIAVGQFLMRFYFAWMTIYLPLYLHEIIGFSWPDIGTILFVMLLPYLFVEWPAGIVADKWLGEKELLIAGFALTVIPTALLVFVSSTSMVVWGALLFVTRIGTALIESMTETYFFKKVSADNTDMITFFRLLRPLAYALAPLSATAVLLYTDMPHLWLVLAIVMLLGVYFAARLKDTK